jgi:hypothetical protein
LACARQATEAPRIQMLEHLDDELSRQLARQLRQERLLALRGQISCGDSTERTGEESSELVCEGASLCGFIWAKLIRSGGALAGGGAESGEGGACHGCVGLLVGTAVL